MTQAQSIPTLARRPIEQAEAEGKLPAQVHTPTARTAPADNLGKTSRFAVCFYSRRNTPLLFPPFTYAVIGTVMEHTKILAFVEAHCHSGAMIEVDNYFGEAVHIESVEDGWQRMESVRDSLRGNISEVQRAERGLIGWLKSIFK